MNAATTQRDSGQRRDVIEMHVRELAQLFDSLDPCPFYERDLDPDAEEYIVASLQELHARAPSALIVYLDQPGSPDDESALERAVRAHFARKAQLTRRELSQLLRQGWISLIIGATFLAALLIGSESVARNMLQGPLATVLRESLVIGGWVAMWKPLEVFLYDWWPILGKAKLYDRLSRIPVRIVHTGAELSPLTTEVHTPQVA